ncbi:exopolysaccharide biosynthesis polyprenyl glycosylphosphotransferase [Nocardioides insulae]|uniref:exopolysaccharide biosynthesis polyprenyl glycosylphosphotransferase n=1 Tax=Nocardioides insulae TaxID=394734 RepID=UPI0004270455|nr:exopolysaccharide biosynthesis polyprenyl glycosylphosphotransferase [Nocardioides insulae]
MVAYVAPPAPPAPAGVRSWARGHTRSLGRVWPLLLPTTDLVVAGAVALLIGLSVTQAGIAVVLWVALVALTARVGSPTAAPTAGVLRAVVSAGLACWIAGAVLTLPTGDVQLAVLVLACGLGSWLTRALLRPRSQRVLVVGGEERHQVAADLLAGSQGRLVPVGVSDPDEADLAVIEHGPDAVLVLPGVDARVVRRLSWDLEAFGTPLLVGTGLIDVAVRRSQPLRLGSVGAIRVQPPPRRGARRWVKQAWERAAAALALVLLAPLLLAVAVAIRLDSRGPVLFRQTRVGRHGRPFTMIKLRTMTTDAERVKSSLGQREGHVLFKMTADPRITRVGRWLRRASLDEVPQLFNVVRGEMSLVGPRPALPDEVARYDIDPLRRLAVTPGLTGLWQVSGRSDLSWEDSVRLDLDYVDNWSLRLDLGILARTVRAVLTGNGAY